MRIPHIKADDVFFLAVSLVFLIIAFYMVGHPTHQLR